MQLQIPVYVLPIGRRLWDEARDPNLPHIFFSIARPECDKAKRLARLGGALNGFLRFLAGESALREIDWAFQETCACFNQSVDVIEQRLQGLAFSLEVGLPALLAEREGPGVTETLQTSDDC